MALIGSPPGRWSFEDFIETGKTGISAVAATCELSRALLGTTSVATGGVSYVCREEPALDPSTPLTPAIREAFDETMTKIAIEKLRSAAPMTAVTSTEESRRETALTYEMMEEIMAKTRSPRAHVGSASYQRFVADMKSKRESIMDGIRREKMPEIVENRKQELLEEDEEFGTW